MSIAPFWYVDDNNSVRWAVRMCHALTSFDPEAGTEIVFTSRDQQISTPYPLDKEHAELSRYELLELLNRAKLEAMVSSHFPRRDRVAA